MHGSEKRFPPVRLIFILPHKLATDKMADRNALTIKALQ